MQTLAFAKMVASERLLYDLDSFEAYTTAQLRYAEGSRRAERLHNKPLDASKSEVMAVFANEGPTPVRL